MKYDAALRKIGCEVVSTEDLPNGSHRIILRAGTKKRQADMWRDTVEAVILQADSMKSSKAPTKWSVDISRYYFAVNGSVKYRWRVIITGDVKRAQDFIAATAIQSLGEHAEPVMSVPLIGPRYQGDPSSGRIKGAHPSGAGDLIVANAMRR